MWKERSFIIIMIYLILLLNNNIKDKYGNKTSKYVTKNGEFYFSWVIWDRFLQLSY